MARAQKHLSLSLCREGRGRWKGKTTNFLLFAFFFDFLYSSFGFFLSSLAVCSIQLVAHTCFFICMKTDKSHVELCTWRAFICLILPSSFLLICHCYVLSVFVLFCVDCIPLCAVKFTFVLNTDRFLKAHLNASILCFCLFPFLRFKFFFFLRFVWLMCVCLFRIVLVYIQNGNSMGMASV